MADTDDYSGAMAPLAALDPATVPEYGGNVIRLRR